MHYLTSILLKFVSAKIDNREPVGFEVINFFRTQISTKYEGGNAIIINVYIKTKFSQIGKAIQNQTNENYNTLMLRLRHKH